MQWVAMHAQPKFVLKTDDDAYVSCAALVGVLQGLCLNPDCENERVYFGQEKRNGVVITEEGQQVEQFGVLSADGAEGICAIHAWWRVRTALK